MNLTVILVGVFVLAIFILPFYFVTHSKSKKENNEELAPRPQIHEPAIKAPVHKAKHRKAKA